MELRIENTVLKKCLLEPSETEVILPPGITVIGRAAFLKCSYLTSITLPDSVEKIEAYAFRGCQALKRISMPDTLSVIETGAFMDCGFETFRLPESLEVIERAVFRNCRQLSELVIPDGVTQIYPYFGSDNGPVLYARQNTPAEDAILASGWPMETLRNEPEETSETVIAGPEFEIRGTLLIACHAQTETVRIPEGITEIGSKSFAGNPHITEVIVPDGVTVIRHNAFASCRNLQRVSLPESLRELGAGAFAYCRELQHLSLPAGLRRIGTECFCGCSNLEPIADLPSGLEHCGYRAFYACECLHHITVPHSMKRISRGAFSGCETLTSVTIPEHITEIQDDAFLNTSLTAITLPPHLHTLGSDALSGTPLSELRLPNSLRGGICIRGSAIREITVPEGVESVCFTECRELEKVQLPKTLKNISASGFEACIKLQSLVIPEGVSVIWNSTFSYCWIRELTLPASVQEINSTAFLLDSGTHLRPLIYAAEGTFAASYAQENGFPWKAPDSQTH